MVNKFRLQIITPKKVVLQDEVDSVTAPSSTGEITILYNHAPLFSLLNEGVVKIRKGNDESFLSIGGGYIETTGKEVHLLVSRAYHQDEIDEEEVKKAREQAENLLKQSKTKKDRHEAMAIFRRSVIDLKVARIKRRKYASFEKQENP